MPFVHLRDGRTGAELRRLFIAPAGEGNNNMVTGVSYSPDGEVLAATAGKSDTLKLWDVREEYAKTAGPK